MPSKMAGMMAGMPRRVRELSSVEVRRINKEGEHAVGGVSGLLLQVSGTGGKSWILRTKVGTRRRWIGLGGFPDVSLSKARELARDTKQKIREGIDPVAERKAAKNAIALQQARSMTFEQAARKKHAAIEDSFRNSKHRQDWLSSLERYAFPIIGDMEVADIEVAHVLKVLEPIWKDKTETATRVRQRMAAVFAWASVSGLRASSNPAEWKGALSELLPEPSKIAKKSHQRALPWHAVPEFMVQLRERKGIGARAFEFLVVTATRSGEVRLATWDEFDLEAKLWTIPAERMKAHKPHKVPLSNRCLHILQSLPRVEGTNFVFASPRGTKLSDMTLSGITKRMGVDAVPHGFRSSFKDWARNQTSFPDEVSELALAHVNSDVTRAAYARDELLEQRAEMMEQWAAFLDGY